MCINKIKSFFRGTKAKAKVEEPKPTVEAAKKEAPEKVPLSFCLFIFMFSKLQKIKRQY